MKNIKIILTLGIIVAILPYTGFPTTFKDYLFLVLGISIGLLAFRNVLKERNSTPNMAECCKTTETKIISDSSFDTQLTDDEIKYQSTNRVHE